MHTPTETIGPTNAPEPGRRRWRWLFYGSCLLLWLAAMAAACEVWARVRTEPPQIPPETVPFSIRNVRDLFEPVYARYSAEWPFPPPDIPPLIELLDADDAFRQEAAETRGEWILFMDRSGIVYRMYGLAPAPLEAPRQAPFPLEALADPEFSLALSEYLDEIFSGAEVLPVSIAASDDPEPRLMRVQFLPQKKNGHVDRVLAAITPSLYRANIKRFRPNTELKTFDTTVMMEQFSTNSFGFRGPEIQVPKPENVVRIVCVGGSTTVWGYTDDLTYPAMLQHKLREHFPADAMRIEVVNCGIFGLTSREEVEMMDEIVHLEPDILVYYNFINDLTVHLVPWMETSEAWSSPVDRMKRLLRRSMFLKQHANEHLLPSRKQLTTLLYRGALNNLTTIINIAEAHDIAPAFCSFAGLEHDQVPEKHRAYAEHENTRRWLPDLDLKAYTRIRALYNRELHHLCERRNVRFIDTAADIHAGYDLFVDLCHFNPLGTEMQADVVFKGIRDMVGERLFYPRASSRAISAAP